MASTGAYDASPRKGEVSPRSYVESPRKSSIDYGHDDDGGDIGQSTENECDKLVLFDDTDQVNLTSVAPSAPPLTADSVDPSAPPTIHSPQAQTSVVFVPVSDDIEEPIALATRLQKSTTIQTGEWEIGLCACFSVCVPTCVMASFCPCIVLAQITARLGLKPYWNALAFFMVTFLLQYSVGGAWLPSMAAFVFDNSSLHTSTIVCGALIITACAIEVVVLLHLRRTIRTRFEIPGTTCGDCCAVCCVGCAVSQMATHLKVYRPGSYDFGPVDVLPAYDDDS